MSRHENGGQLTRCSRGALVGVVQVEAQRELSGLIRDKRILHVVVQGPAATSTTEWR